MAKYRYIYLDFWKDPKVTEEMSAEDRYAMLYLLSNPYTTQIGIYAVTKRQIAFDLGYSTESVSAILERFEKLHKLIKYNADTREIAIRNWGKYNLIKGGKPILDCINSELPKVKDKSLIKYVAEGIPNETIKETFLRYVDDTPTIGGQKENKKQNKNENKNKNNNTIENDVVVVDKIKSYFDLSEEEVLKIHNAFKETNKDLDYLEEKLIITKNTDCKSIVGFLIKSIQEDYKPHKNNVSAFIPKVRTRFHNINSRIDKYSPDELERIVKENQDSKFKRTTIYDTYLRAIEHGLDSLSGEPVKKMVIDYARENNLEIPS